MTRAITVFVALAAAGVCADEIHLHGGGRLIGIVVEKTAQSVEIEVGAGRVTVPLSVVARIVASTSALSHYQARARELPSNDVEGWLDLAEWAHASELSTQAREAYLRVLDVEPGNATARRGLGYTQVGSEWMTKDEAMQARGYVLLDGDWVTEAYRDSVLMEREAERRHLADTERARLELAEAEARAREAEARARVAEAEAKRATDDVFLDYTGIPTQFVVLPCCGTWHLPGHCPRSRHGHRGSHGRDDRRRITRPAEEPTAAPLPPKKARGATAKKS
jgi:hypothetical protein